MKRFKLEIKLGNAAMLDPNDVAAALTEVAESLRDRGFGYLEGAIRDENGNVVGSWEVTK